MNCPICEQRNIETLFTIGDVDQPLLNVICKNCALVFIDETLTEPDYEHFQAASGKASGHHRERSEEELSEKLSGSDARIKSTVADFVEPYIQKNTKLLDIGCGFGNFLRIVRERTGVTGDALEINLKDIEVARNRFNLPVFEETLKEFHARNKGVMKYDVIVLHNVLEHFPSPAEEFERVKDLLSPGGVLYIGVPNIANMKKRPEWFFMRGHPFSYSPASLKKLLEKARLKIISFNAEAGYPGGMEAIAVPEEDPREMPEGAALLAGADWREIIRFVKKKKVQYDAMRFLKHSLFFWVPLDARNRFGKKVYQTLRPYL